CGPDSACGKCPTTAFQACVPDCTDAECGSLTQDGCGLFCSVCEPGQPGCQADSECPEGFVCGLDNGDRFGSPGENVCWRESCLDEEAPCGAGTECGECPVCTPQCNDAAPCGDDGCGGDCGTCTAPLECRAGSCTDTSV